jgi:hypothetical protein
MSNTPSAFSANPVSPLSIDILNDISVVHELYPRISEKIKQLWGSSDLNHYLNSIIFDDRGGRQGFPEQVANALIRVYENHASLVRETKKGDIWDVILDQIK